MDMLRKVYVLLTGRERRQLAILAVTMVLVGLVETAGVASVLPFMQLVSDPTVLQQPGWAGDLYAHFGFVSTKSALFAAGALLLGIIAFNNLITALGVWAIGHWAWGVNHRLSTTLLARYLRQPYPFFLDRNTAELNRRLLEEVGSVVTGVILPGMELAARGLAALFIITLLSLVDARLALLVTLLFGGSYGVTYAFLRKAQTRFGQRRFDANGLRFRIAGEALAGIKDVKTLGREEEFLRRFTGPSRQFAVSAARSLAVARAPRYLLETIGFGTILVIILLGLQQGSDLSGILPTLSLYAFAGYRLMPAINAIFQNVLVIRFNAVALDVLFEDLVVVAGEQPPETPADDVVVPAPHGVGTGAIELHDVRFRYPEAHRDTLVDLDLHVSPKEIIALVGKTGVGKTTLADLVLGLLEPSDGTIVVDGEALEPATARAWRKRCGYVPQEVFLADDTVRANIAFGVPDAEVDPAAVEAAATVAQLHDFVTTLPAGYDTIIGERGTRLSGGQRQRIGIARALYEDPEVLVLDEATSALDGVTESAVMDTIRGLARQKTIIVIAHRLSTVKACDAIYVMEHGCIVARGTYDELVRDHKGFRAMAGELGTS
jgi:ABC-type multidrug transport system fused ATPase/permease subunit